MNRSSLLSLTLVLAALTACADSPTAPRAFGGDAIQEPLEAAAPAGTLGTIMPLTGFGAGAVSAINNLHETAGWSYTTGASTQAFFRSATGAMIQVGPATGNSVALGLNDGSSVVGYSYTTGGRYHAFLSKVANGALVSNQDLGTVSGGDRSLAYAINSTGTIVGFIYTGDGKQHAARWVPPYTVGEDLGTLGGTRSVAYAINDGGTIVGFSTNASGQTRGFVWTAANGMQDVGTLGGTAAVARAINSKGEIVGSSTTSGGVYHAFKRSATGTMVDLGTGSTGGPSYGYGISATGQVVGWSVPATGPTLAQLWSATNVNSELGGSTAAASSEVYAMNDNNEAVGMSNGQATIWYIGNRTPTASFVSAAHSKVLQTPEDFSGAASSDPDGDALTYSWNFGDALNPTTNTGTGVTASHLYSVKGTYTVSLTVTDTHGFSNTQTQSIRIN